MSGAGGVGGYVYDQFGRQTTIPAADAPNPAGGAVTVAYFDDDLPQAVTEGPVSSVFTLDAAGRRSVQTTTDAAGTTTTTRRYTDDSDNPAWIDVSGPAGTSTTRYTEGIGDDLSASIATDGAVVLSLSDPHGDVVTTVDIPATQTGATPAAGIDGWADYTEYGTPTTTSSPAAIATVSGAAGYGWLGAKQRSTTDATAGLTLMGVRLYNPATGQFTSLDPILGGNTTGYAYPQDPINMYDLNGMCLAGLSWACKAAKAVKTAGKWAVNHRGTIATVAAFGICIGSAGVGCAAAQGAAWAIRSQQRGYKKVRANAADLIYTIGAVGIGQALKAARAGMAVGVPIGSGKNVVPKALRYLVAVPGYAGHAAWQLRKKQWR